MPIYYSPTLGRDIDYTNPTPEEICAIFEDLKHSDMAPGLRRRLESLIDSRAI